jgi:hypothetical protein
VLADAHAAAERSMSGGVLRLSALGLAVAILGGAAALGQPDRSVQLQQQATEAAQQSAAVEKRRQEEAAAAAARGARIRAGADRQRQEAAAATRSLVMGLDPARIESVALAPRPPVPCRLRARTAGECTQIINGPALLLSLVATGWLDLVAAPGDQALAQGQYAWHVTWQGQQTLAIKAGESLYVVGKLAVWDRDTVLTLYRP